MTEPKPYTAIGGGGPNPPHGEDYFGRIVNVHWPKKLGPMTGGVFIAGDYDSNIYYMKVGEGGKIDPTGALPVWQNLGTLDFTLDDGMFNGRVQGSAYGLVNDKNPVFVLVGGGGTATSRGIIMASRDGLSWSRAFSFGVDSGTYRGANLFGVVWDGTSFWAGGHQTDNFSEGDVNWMSETDILFHSSDGFSWNEAGRFVLRIDKPVGGPFPPWPDYITGLLAAHCSGKVVDSYGNGVPGGNYGYDADNNILLAPIDPSVVEYFYGGVSISTPNGVSNRGADVPFPVDPGLPILCTATAGGTWVYAGGRKEPSLGMATVLLPSPGDAANVAWQQIDPPSSKLLVTLCGGAVEPPPA